jgi:hypothetical protein
MHVSLICLFVWLVLLCLLLKQTKPNRFRGCGSRVEGLKSKCAPGLAHSEGGFDSLRVRDVVCVRVRGCSIRV